MALLLATFFRESHLRITISEIKMLLFFFLDMVDVPEKKGGGGGGETEENQIEYLNTKSIKKHIKISVKIKSGVSGGGKW